MCSFFRLPTVRLPREEKLNIPTAQIIWEGGERVIRKERIKKGGGGGEKEERIRGEERIEFEHRISH